MVLSTHLSEISKLLHRVATRTKPTRSMTTAMWVATRPAPTTQPTQPCQGGRATCCNSTTRLRVYRIRTRVFNIAGRALTVPINTRILLTPPCPDLGTVRRNQSDATVARTSEHPWRIHRYVLVQTQLCARAMPTNCVEGRPLQLCLVALISEGLVMLPTPATTSIMPPLMTMIGMIVQCALLWLANGLAAGKSHSPTGQ